MGVTGSRLPMSNPASRTFMLDAIHEHGGSINCMTLSEDASVLVTGSEDRSVRLWTTKTKRCDCIGILTGHENYISTVVVEEVCVFSGSADMTVRKWDMSTCQCLLVFRGHTGRVNRILCIGDFIFSTSIDRTIRCWDADNGACIREFVGHKNGIFPIVYVPVEDSDDEEDTTIENGPKRKKELEGADEDKPSVARDPRYRDIIISGSTDGTARSWSFESGRALQIFSGHGGPVTKVATDVDAKLLFTCSTDTTVRCWNIKSGKLLRVFDMHSAAVVCITVVNRIVYTGSVDHTARAWFLDRKIEDSFLYTGHEHTVMCIRYHEGLLLTADAEGIIFCRDARTGEIKRTFRGPPKSIINNFQVVDHRLFTGSTDGTLRVWTLRGLIQQNNNDDDDDETTIGGSVEMR